MYILINNTTRKTQVINGGWPGIEIDELLEKGHKLIVISLRSNTIKVPKRKGYMGSWEWDEYKLPDPMVLLKYSAEYKSLPFNL